MGSFWVFPTTGVRIRTAGFEPRLFKPLRKPVLNQMLKWVFDHTITHTYLHLIESARFPQIAGRPSTTPPSSRAPPASAPGCFSRAMTPSPPLERLPTNPSFPQASCCRPDPARSTRRTSTGPCRLARRTAGSTAGLSRSPRCSPCGASRISRISGRWAGRFFFLFNINILFFISARFFFSDLPQAFSGTISRLALLNRFQFYGTGCSGAEENHCFWVGSNVYSEAKGNVACSISD